MGNIIKTIEESGVVIALNDSGKVHVTDGNIVHSGGIDDFVYSSVSGVSFFNGYCLPIKRKALNEIITILNKVDFAQRKRY